jgi:AcrR family transcriptional regulator
MTSDERRAAILEAAVRLFAKRGFRGTTTRALAEAVGVTEPVLYEHFKSKRDLYCAIIESKSQQGWARGNALLQPHAEARDDAGFFTSLGEFILDCYAADPDYARLLLFVALEDPELGMIFYERQKTARECLASYIGQRIEEGVFRPVDPAIAARVFMGMFFHHMQVNVLYQDNFIQRDKKQIVREMVEIFLRGMVRESCS